MVGVLHERGAQRSRKADHSAARKGAPGTSQRGSNSGNVRSAMRADVRTGRRRCASDCGPGYK